MLYEVITRLLEADRQIPVGGGHHRPGRPARRNLPREGRARQDGDPAGMRGGCLREDLRHPQERFVLQPFRERHQDGPRRKKGRRGCGDRPEMVGRHREGHDRPSGERLFEGSRRADPFRNRDAGQSYNFV